jgi:hypothetical protein
MPKTITAITKPPTLTSPPSTLTAQITELVHACFSGLYIETREPEEAIRDLTQLARRESWRLGIWDCDSGLKFPSEDVPVPSNADTNDPLAVLRSAGQLSQGSETTLLVLQNFHRFLGATEILQAVQKQVSSGKHTRTFVVILAPVVNLPPEIEKQFIVVEHELPGREQLREIASGIAQGDELPAGDDLARVLDSAAGLTRYEAEGAFSLSIVRHGKLDPACIWDVKGQQLKKSGLVSIHRGTESFDQLGGLENLKAFCLRAMRRQSEGQPNNRPRGVLLLSPPGCGKSQFAKALGNETGRPTVVLDVGALLGSLVGQSESNVRAALKLADAMAPCVLFCDEIEKALAGASSSGQTDSGVTARVFGSLLTWLNDHESDVFFVGTCNDASKLPPEFARAERFDGVFFVDLPGRDQKDAIWAIYTRRYGLDVKQARPDDTNWTGAEIKSCCRLASLLDVPLIQAAQNVVPVAVTAGDKIEGLRQWAAGRVLSADQPGIYSRESGAVGNSRVRRVMREPGRN